VLASTVLISQLRQVGGTSAAAMVAFTLPADTGTKEYLEKSKLLLSLEAGLEETLQHCMSKAEQGQSTDAVRYLATWLMRNNPKHSAGALKKLEAHREAVQQRAEKEAAKEAAIQRKAKEASEVLRKLDGTSIQLSHEHGELDLRIDLSPATQATC